MKAQQMVFAIPDRHPMHCDWHPGGVMIITLLPIIWHHHKRRGLIVAHRGLIPPHPMQYDPVFEFLL